ncbi:signal transduction histidine kinase [Crossiella equi]|uniref:histidine kinase n=1 Tax=Crossiella equi TaxID=130796 RepID=A0ABS5ASL3_9PSEU|nr:sensor histidine kinase [Crossiella equi]MBP2479565.1 signal transduction histidine kinase [Crossiella equi]
MSTARRLPGMTLRWRVAVAFGLVAFLITSVLAAATWGLASDYMLRQREQSALRQASVNVTLLDRSLREGAQSLDELLTGLTSGADSTILLRRADSWVTSGHQADARVLPQSFRELARQGVPATQRIRVHGEPALAVTLPITAERGSYTELFPLVALDRAFRFLSTLLIAGTLAAGLSGVLLGLWTSRRALRPLTEFTEAAARVAAGDLAARLPQHRDPDLAPLATTFNNTAQTLDDRVRQDARFASDVSHELRSPLTTMVNAVAVIHRRRAELPTPAQRAADLLASVVGGFQRLVVDLLEISRNYQTADDDDLELVDLGALVRNVVDDRSPAPELDLPSLAPLVLGDRRRLDRVLANLLDNAEAHAGGAVRVRLTGTGERARLEVEDNGPGVPGELRERIFERFARGSRSGQRGSDSGSGLGLALVAQHVARHGGAVWVEDRPGGGARFVVELPQAGG